ncbi:MAG: HD domain-containing phosphohydrolase, partial [Candidatus Scalindua sp.]
WGRICAVADVFDALSSKRPYKEAFSKEKTLEIMKESRGKHFEPKLIDLFLENIDKVLVIQKKYKEK